MNKFFPFKLFGISLSFVLLSHFTQAQDETISDSNAVETAPVEKSDIQKDLDRADVEINMLIIESHEIRSGEHHKKKLSVAMLGDTIVMKVKNLDLLLLKRTLDNPIILYINRLPFETIVGHRNLNHHDELWFVLTRNSSDNEDWNEVLRSGFHEKSFDLSIGLKDKSLVSNNVRSISFHLRSLIEFIPFMLLVGLLIVLTWYLVFRKGLLRVNLPGDNSYSLSSIHLFFWTGIILSSYMIIWWCCDDINSIESSNLILMGISAATTSAGAIINGTKNNPGTGKPITYKSLGFIQDLFSENNSVSIHRYQIVVFNLVIGVFFIYRVMSELTMPVLDPTILTMLGISSATYASVKAIKAKDDPADPNADPATDSQQTDGAPVNQ